MLLDGSIWQWFSTDIKAAPGIKTGVIGWCSPSLLWDLIPWQSSCAPSLLNFYCLAINGEPEWNNGLLNCFLFLNNMCAFEFDNNIFFPCICVLYHVKLKQILQQMDLLKQQNAMFLAPSSGTKREGFRDNLKLSGWEQKDDKGKICFYFLNVKFKIKIAYFFFKFYFFSTNIKLYFISVAVDLILL